MIKSIIFIENKQNIPDLYPGSFWILSYDENGKQVAAEDGKMVDSYQFNWDDREKAYQTLEELKIKYPLADVMHKVNEKPKSFSGILHSIKKREN